MKDKFLISIMGPTASGKTNLAIQLAKHFQTEIISADSRQFYKGLDIGTAKPSREELASVKHHFIDCLEVGNEYNAGKFEDDALKTLDQIFEKNDFAVMVGGSGLYLNAVLFGIDPFPEIPRETRFKALNFYKEKGLQALRDELRSLDPIYFLEVDLDNPRRLMRALEVCYASGKPYSSFRNQGPQPRNFQAIKIAYQWDRKLLYDRIDMRVDHMIENGLIGEAQRYSTFKESTALNTIGYKEIFEFLNGNLTKSEAIDLVKRNSRRYAKRQSTW
ncbi:MAG: tRNA (adenosine(37)-N6)-dimethylallyltransferase MiaA, partial [Candidatus Paceibacterota bacterium]